MHGVLSAECCASDTVSVSYIKSCFQQISFLMYILYQNYFSELWCFLVKLIWWSKFRTRWRKPNHDLAPMQLLNCTIIILKQNIYFHITLSYSAYASATLTCHLPYVSRWVCDAALWQQTLMYSQLKFVRDAAYCYFSHSYVVT